MNGISRSQNPVVTSVAGRLFEYSAYAFGHHGSISRTLQKVELWGRRGQSCATPEGDPMPDLRHVLAVLDDILCA
jgi:hypothetical protein